MEVNFVIIIVLVIVLILKLMLDLNLAIFLVKTFSGIPVRNIFREKPYNLVGEWEILWDSGGSKLYAKNTDRHGHTTLKQLGSYVYAEFTSQKIKYAFFGKIKGNYIVGDWFDMSDISGYFGVFQLEIVNSNILKGVWIGHSKSQKEIRTDTLNFTKCNS